MTDRDRLHHIIAGLAYVALVVLAIAAWQACDASQHFAHLSNMVERHGNLTP